MCAEYQIKATISEIQAELGFPIQKICPADSWSTRIKMSLAAPVIGVKEGEIRLNELIFPVDPFPNARLSQLESNKTEVADAEDQIVRIYDIPLWKAGFEKYPCLVPMTSFFEPTYWGPFRGDVVEFRDPEHKILFVPSFLIKPREPATGKLNGFSLLTHTASKQIVGYHHRLLVFLEPQRALAYLKMEDLTAEERFEFLLAYRYVPDFNVSFDRVMAKNWERRVEDHEHALANENRYVEALKREGVKG